MNKIKRILIYAVIALAVLAGVYYFFFFKSSSNSISYVYDEIKRDTIVHEVTATGVLNDSLSVDVGTQVTGIITKIFVDFNSRVKKDQVIALIDTVVLRSAVIDAQAALLKTQSIALQQKNEYNRYVGLLAKKAVTQSDFDQEKATYLSAQSDEKAAEADLHKAVTNLNYATIKAPINGVVINRNVNVGNTVVASFQTPTLFTIANDLHKMQVQASVDEADIGGVRLGQEVKFTVDAYPEETFIGTVVQIRLAPQVNQNVVTYNVMIDVFNPDLKLLPGMNANLYFIIDEHKNVLTVPMAAIFFDPHTGATIPKPNQKQVTIWVACDSASTKIENCSIINGVKMAPINVNKGLDNGSLVEISGDGIHEGMKVMISMVKNVKATRGLLSRPQGAKPLAH